MQWDTSIPSDYEVHQKRSLMNISEENSLRVTVDGGGCSGFQYKFEINDAVGDEDVVLEKDGIQIITDKISLDFMTG